MKEHINLKSKGYTEEEKNDLFCKLKKIGKLFGLNLSIERHEDNDNSSAFIGEDRISVGLCWNSKDIYAMTYNNIDDVRKCLLRDEYLLFPEIIHTFLHEVSHLLTMTKYDIPKYREDYADAIRSDIFGMTKIKYRELPYEKLADNLAYHLLINNYEQIIKILLGKRVRIDCRKVSMNTKLAKSMKMKYIAN